MEQLLEMVQPYGLGGLLLLLVGWMMKRVFNSSDLREKNSIRINEKFLDGLNKLDLSITSHQSKTGEFMGHIRREHENLCADHVKLSKQMSEVTEILGRINGYKK